MCAHVLGPEVGYRCACVHAVCVRHVHVGMLACGYAFVVGGVCVWVHIGVFVWVGGCTWAFWVWMCAGVCTFVWGVCVCMCLGVVLVGSRSMRAIVFIN